MTLPSDPPRVRRRAAIGAVRSQGTFQIALGVVCLVFAVVAATQGAEWWTVVIAAFAGAVVIASGIVAWAIAGRRLRELEPATVVETADVTDAVHVTGAEGIVRATTAADAPKRPASADTPGDPSPDV